MEAPFEETEHGLVCKLRGGGVAVLDGQDVLFGVGAREHADDGAYLADPGAGRPRAPPRAPDHSPRE